MEAVLPTTLEEVLDALDKWPDSTLLAGGTDVMVEANFGHRRPERVIALRKVAELKEWSGGHIGAGVTWRRMETGPYPALAQLARTVGSPQIRSAGTMGGNLGTASPAGDGHPFLAAVDAEIELRSKQGSRRLPWNEFFTGVKKTARRSNEVITAAVLPDHMPPRQAFGKVGVRSAMVIATVCACLVRENEGSVRIALGSVAPTVMRARRAEEMISVERKPSDAARAEFARLVSEDVQPIDDHRSTALYRRHAAGVLARRLLERVLS